MTTFTHDGVVFDLTVPLADVIGVEWTWTGGYLDGEPLLVAAGSTVPAPLPTVYRDHGPLIPIQRRPSAAQYQAAIDPDYADTVAAGYVETPAEFGRRIAAPKPDSTPPTVPAVTVPKAAGQVLAPSPLEQRGFRAFLKSLRGGA